MYMIVILMPFIVLGTSFMKERVSNVGKATSGFEGNKEGGSSDEEGTGSDYDGSISSDGG